MFTARKTGGDISNHDCLRLPYKGVFKHHSQLRASKRSMSFVLVQSPDTLLEGEQRFINFRTVHPSLLILVIGICPSLITSQVNKRNLPEGLPPFNKLYLEDSMRSRRVSVHPSSSSHPIRVSIVNHIHEIINSSYLERLQAYNVDPLLSVHSGMEQLLVVEKIIQLPAVDLKETDKNSEFFVFGGLQLGKDILGRQNVKTLHSMLTLTNHGVSFTRAGLPISETGDISLFKGKVNQRFDSP